jgi:alkylation response protein AidB-like acyl-CoA dehydrogenase
MDSPGITVRPIVNMAGHHGFNEVFFNDVRIPRTNLIGELNNGWKNLSVALDLERSGIEWNANARRRLDDVLEFVRRDGQVAHSSDLRAELAQRAIEVEVGRLLCYQVAYLQSVGRTATYESSVAKIYNSELIQNVARTALKALGPFGALSGADQPLEVRPGHDMVDGYLLSVAATIGAGSNEIQRNIVAKALGLPLQPS